MRSTESLTLHSNGKSIANQSAVLTFQKFKSIYPYVIVSVIVHYLTVAAIQKPGIWVFLKNIGYSIFEMALLPMSGIKETFYVLPLWYLSGVFLVFPVMAYLVFRFRDGFSVLAAPLTTVFIYGWFSVTYGELDKWNVWTGFCYVGVLRVVAGLCLGCACYLLVKKLEQIKIPSYIAHAAQIFCFGAVTVCTFFKGHSRYDFILVVLLALGIMSAVLSPWRPGPTIQGICVALGKLSLPLYTSHWTARYLVVILMPDAGYTQMLLPYLILSVLMTVVELGIVIIVQRTVKKASWIIS